MADKKIGISLAFQADTAQARAQIQSLQTQLSELSKTSAINTNLGNIDNINAAITGVTKLSSVLKNATTNAGTLDLTKFTNGLKQANLSAEKIAADLGSLGPAGVQAFSQLSQAVLTAEVPIKRVNQHISNFMDGLKRTAGWQIQSTMIHKFTGAIQQAYGYAQDLNESLTNIRIVTGQSTEQMTQFAKEANKAAKELSTTTTAYTDAALIFYQQGLTGEDVTKRTDTVIKMANVTGQSAEEVSSYMTAIWNNFDDGSKSLEHYADVITALGASTASSSAEIAEGLEKFAAIGNTVGLSYEYATSALATVVAQTRQSADTVGTAFKTLFARIQDLEVGKTLDDGTTLGKYAQALESIGVNIKDTSGQVKDMDVILDEMGNKWKTIDKNTQIAVAQAVAGTRQYSQLMALMSNYDTFKSNIDIANSAEGALQEQANIYAESWEGAQKRVKASLEGIYDSLINDKFFIDFNNKIADMFQNINKVVDAIGGFKTILPAIGLILTKYFGKSMSAGLISFKQSLVEVGSKINVLDKKWNLKDKTTQSKNNKVRTDFTNQLQEFTGDNTISGSAAADNLKIQSDVQNKFLAVQEKLATQNIELTEQEKAYVQSILETTKALQEEANATVKLYDTRQNNSVKNQVANSSNISAGNANRITLQAAAKGVRDRVDSSKVSTYAEGSKEFKQFQDSTNKYFEKFEALTGTSTKKLQAYVNEAKNGKELFDKLNQYIINVDNDLTKLGQGLEETDRADLQNLINQFKEVQSQAGDAAFSMARFEEGAKEAEKNADGLGQNTITLADRFIGFTQAAMSAAMAIQAIQGLGSIWTDEDASIGDKVLQTVMSLGMILPGITAAYQGMSAALKVNTAETEVNTAAKIANAIAQYLANIPMLAIVAIVAILTAAIIALNVAYQKRLKVLEDESKKAKANAEIHKKNVEALKEEQNQVQELSNAYNNLFEKYDSGELSAEEMRRQAYQLCMQYGEESLAIRALAGDYKALQEAIDKREGSIAQNIADEAKQEKASYKDSLNYGIKASALKDKKYNEDSGTIDLKMGAIAGNSKAEKELLQGLKNLNISVTGDDINIKEFLQAAEDNYDALNKLLVNNSSKAAIQLKGYLEANKESLEGIAESTKDYNDATLNAIAKSYSTNTIKNIGDYADQISNMAHDALSAGVFKSIEDAKAWANAYMAAIDEVSNYAQTYSIADALVDTARIWKTSSGTMLTSAEMEKWYQNKINILQKQIDTEIDKYYSDLGNQNNWQNSKLTEIVSEENDKHTKYYDAVAGEYVDYYTATTSKGQQVKYNKTSDGNYYFVGDGRQAMASYEKDLRRDQIQNYKDERDNFRQETLYFAKNTAEALSEYDIGTQAAFANFQQGFRKKLNEGLSIRDALKELQAENSEAFKYYGAQAGMDYTSSLAKTINQENRKLSKDEINKLKEVYNFDTDKNETLGNGASLEDQSKLNQMVSLLYMYADASDEAKAHWEDAAKSLQEQANLIKDSMQKDIFEAYESFEDLSYDTEQLEKLQAIKAKGKEATTEETEALKIFEKKLEQYNQTTGTTVTAEDLLNKERLNSRKEYKNLIAQVGALSEGTLSYAEVMKSAEDIHKEFNSSIDKVQSAYKTLSSAVKEYNNSGFLSMDTLQSILELEPAYINCLADENGQLQLNEESMVAYAKAQLAAEMAAEASAAIKKVETSYTDEKILSEIEEQTVLASGIAVTLDSAEANLRHAQSLILGKKAYEDLSDAEKARYDYLEAYIKKMQIAKTTSDNMSTAMFHSDKSSKKFFEDEFDRYWEFKKAIESVEHELSKLEEQQSHLYGQELIDNLNQVNALLVQQKANYEALAEAQAVEADELRSTLSKYGAQFDENGGLSNYADVTTSMFRQYAGAEDSEEYEEFKKALERFDTLFYSEMVDTADKAAEASRKVMENNLKIWETDLQINLDLKQAKRDWNDFIHSLSKDIKSATKDIGKELSYNLSQIDTYNLVDGTIGSDIQKIENINYEIEQLKNGGTSQFFASLSEAENALKEANETLRSDVLDMQGLVEDMWSAYLEGIDQVAEGLEKINQQFDDIDDSLEHQIKLTELLYGKEAYDKMDKIYSAQAENSKNQLSSLRQQVDTWQKEYELAVARDGADSESAKKAWENLRQARKSLNEEEEHYIEVLQAKRNNAIDSVIENARKKIKQARTEWDDIDKQNEGTYDDTERMYQLHTMQNKWNKLISNTSGLKNQQKLAQVMGEQMEYLKEKTRLTEYDIGLAEKELAVAQAQIALEEAQNSKNTMKLTRGADGNWSYQYVADEDDVANKQQALLDAVNDKYEYIKAANKKSYEDLMTYSDEYLVRYKEIISDTSLSDEEKAKKANALYETYYGANGIITHIQEQAALTERQLNATTAEVIQGLYEADEDSYNNMTESERALIDGLKDGTISNQEEIVEAGKRCNDESLEYWGSTAKAMADEWELDDGESVKSRIKSAMEECEGFMADYNVAVEEGCEAAGEDFKDIESAVDDINFAIGDLSTVTETYLTQASQDLENYRGQVDAAMAAWQGVKAAVEQNITSAKKYILAANEATNAAKNLKAAQEDAKNSGGSSNGGDRNPPEEKKQYEAIAEMYDRSGSVISTYDRKDLIKEIKTISTNNLDSQNVVKGETYDGSTYTDEQLATYSDEDLIELANKLARVNTNYYREDWSFEKYATGGYTGEWGDESGRIAMLHQKELVLNAKDTENLLEAVYLMRKLSSSINTSITDRLNNMMNSWNSAMSSDTMTNLYNQAKATAQEAMNNVFNITAEFPNADSVDEIREAILSLPNYVSQYVGR